MYSPLKIKFGATHRKNMSQAVKFATWFREVIGSNPGQYTENCKIQNYSGFL